MTLSSKRSHKIKPGKAVDGRRNPYYKNCAVSAIQSPDAPLFLRVDLGKESMIGSVGLQNRINKKTRYRMNPFDVMIGDSLANQGFDNPKCVDRQNFTQVNQYLRFNCPYIMTGRYVVVTNYHLKRTLEICELEVYGWQ